MEYRNRQLKFLLLDMLSTRCDVDQVLVSALDSHDWDLLLEITGQYGLGSLLHWRLSREHADLPVPRPVLDELAKKPKRAMMRALLMRRQLVLVHRILDDLGIPNLALKGAYLAFYAYPHAALRPMRDLDILIPKERVLEAYQALLDAGFTKPNDGLRVGMDVYLRDWQHLPPVISPQGHVEIELHFRISDPRKLNGVSDLAAEKLLWNNPVCIDASGDRLCYLSSTNLLLHLIDHAIYHHQLEVGPIVFSDLAYLLETHEIDWPFFWQQTEFYARTKGTLLLLTMVERYFGEQRIEWFGRAVNSSISPDIIEVAALLTLQDLDSKQDANIERAVAKKNSFSDKLGVYLKALFPAKSVMSKYYPASERSLRIYFWYLVRWRYQLTVRLREYLAFRKRERASGDVRNALKLEHWLE